MVEGLYGGFYYVVRGRVLTIYGDQNMGPALKTYCVALSAKEYDLHTVAWCRIDLDKAALSELHQQFTSPVPAQS